MEEQNRGENAGQTKPKRLFHYTTQTGLDGILTSDSIWATHYRFLNDSMERRYGLTLFKEALFRVAFKKFGALDASNTLVDYFEQTTTDVLDAYIVSFCTDTGEDVDGGDRLSQWRGYSRGAQGYCLVFDLGLTSEFHAATPQASFFESCIYSETEQLNLCEKLSNSLLDGPFRDLTVDNLMTYDSLRQTVKEGHSKNSDWNEFALTALLFSNLFKHSGFSEEREYRLLKFFTLKSDTSGIQFRPGKDNPVPYIAISLALKKANPPIKRIVVGPSLNKEQVAINLGIRLRQMGLGDIEVETSKIPYRG
ncbi:MAG: DUF2971 domain-containing protein [Terracidiphilus sp.]|nr:DUF2971 domain-containing protein [Terracidiphilus sp.]MDR3799687.1 DUF2971 domain-containing protein [Terracidiphilus sp.]